MSTQSPMEINCDLIDAAGTGGFVSDGDWIESKDQDPDGDVRIIQLADIGIGKFLNKSRRFMNSAAAKRLKCTFLQQGDLLLARMPDPIGRTCIFPGDERPCVTAVDICIIRLASPDTDAHWLTHRLNSPNFLKRINREANGSTRQRIPTSVLKRMTFSRPSIEEQRRIAAILDQAEALRAKRRQALAKLDTLTQSLFLEMFGKDHVFQDHWDIAPISELGEVSTGRTPPGDKEGMFDGPVPFITPGDLAGLNGEGAKRSLTLTGASHVRLARAGATAVCCIGATIGKMGILTSESAFNQQINVVEWCNRIDDVYGFLAMTQLKEEIASRGASTTMPILKKSAFEKLFLPVPPLSLQRNFRIQVEALMGARAHLRKQQKALKLLCASLQSVAFSGGL